MPDCASEVLVAARGRRRAADRAEADLLMLAVQWADMHPVESIEDGAATIHSRLGDSGIPVAGRGAPLVAEFATMEFAAAVGLPSEAGKRLIGEAVELRYRLPKVWQRVTSGDLQSWRGRGVAQRTQHLSLEAAAFVDAHVAPVAHKVRPAQVERMIDEAIARFMPETAAKILLDSLEDRHVTVNDQQISFEGTVEVTMGLDLADAVDFEAAVKQGAARLAKLGSPEPLDARRALAVGEMSRSQLALEFPSNESAASSPQKAVRRRVVLYVHLSDAAIGSRGCDDYEIARLENGSALVTPEQVKAWCGVPGTQVVVKPLIDLNEQVRVDQYEVPDRIAEHVALRDGCCVFPWCSRPARRIADGFGGDNDHVVPHSLGGQTDTANIAPLCRRHHRLKTHGGWSYTVIEPGTYLWSTPHGYQYLRDNEGTLDVSRDQRPSLRAHPPDGQRSSKQILSRRDRS